MSDLPLGCARRAWLALRWLAMLTVAASANAGSGLVIPAVAPMPAHSMTVDDEMAIRSIDIVSVSPDGRHVAMFVRQPDPARNEFLTGWFAVDLHNGRMTSLGDGGEVGPQVMFTGHMPGRIGVNEHQWSPDGKWFAYTLRRDGEVQLWRSRVDGGVQEQLTANAADVREFAWNDSGKELYFSVGTPRAEIQARERARSHEGYRYDEDFWQFTDLLAPRLLRPLETDLSVWVVNAESREERLGSEADRTALHSIRKRQADAVEGPRKALTCKADECAGAIKRVWSSNQKEFVFWRGEGINDTEHAFYSWSQAAEQIALLLRLRDDELRLCQATKPAQLVCVRENASTPDQLVVLDLKAGSLRVLADVNPEFRTIRLGKVERFEWRTPEYSWHKSGGALAGLYPARTYGYILYPPDFDANKKYPVFVDPYVASGFEPLGAEHPLHVYAANGIVVLRTAMPLPRENPGMKLLYSEDLGFPHLTMLMESTLRGLDATIGRGFIDERRVGIGGVSHGTFVPLYLMQKHDRIAAISISSPSWGPMQRYWSTRKAREMMATLSKETDPEWSPVPETEAGRNYWRKIDIADNVDTLEAPLLMHFAAQETYGMVRFIRNLADANKPYDAYVFPAETHLKWQPAHLKSIAGRNLDWFRFWLRDHEDATPAKREQYERWRELRKLQCANPRSLRACAE